MLKLINSFLSQGNKEKDKENEKEELVTENINKDKYIDLEKDSKDILCFMKYCFTEKKMFKPMNMVNVALSEYNVCNIIIKVKHKEIQPLVSIKIKNYSDSTKFFSPKKIYKYAKSLYLEFYNKNELNLYKLNVAKIRECIINLILYGTVLNNNIGSLIPLELLINTLYLLKDFDKIQSNIKENTNIINENKNNIIENKNVINENNNIINENKNIINEEKNTISEEKNLINEENNIINKEKGENNNEIIEENKEIDK
jgi:hypothetical protein